MLNTYNKDNPLRCFFAFEGYNSQGLALKRLKQNFPGFDWVCVGRSEIDRNAIAAANALFPEAKDKNFGSITDIDWSQVPDFDLFTYSFPCTDISSAGLQAGFDEGSGTRSSLLWECKRAIVEKQPKYLLMENVKALTQKKFLPLFNKWLNLLTSYGYTNYWRVLNAADFGIPQNRERVFAVSIHGEHKPFAFPNGRPLEMTVEDILEDASDVPESYYFPKEKSDEVLDDIVAQPRTRKMLEDLYHELWRSSK